MNRRTSIRLVVLATASTALTSCGRNGNSSATTPKPSEHNVLDLLEDLAIIGIFVGKQLEKFPHPAMRITGIVLETGSELLVTYIALDRASEERHQIKISASQSREFETAGKVIVQVKNGRHEERCIDALNSRM